MNLESLDFFFKSFADEQMNFLYTGDFSDNLTDRLVDLNNLQYDGEAEYKISHRKAGFLIAECFQNIVRHSDISNNDNYFHIKNTNDLFSIISGNSVHNNLTSSLKEQIEQLNKLTAEELRNAYRKVLFDGQFSDKGGAGLGLIEMARRTKNKLSFNFSPIDEIKTYFYLQLQYGISQPRPVNTSFESSKLYRNKMLKDHLFLIYKGVFSTQVSIAILSIIEDSLESVDQKVIFIRLMELMEKVSIIDLPTTNGSSMLFIGENGETYNISTTFLLNSKDTLSISRTFQFYKTLDKKSLTNEYLNQLKQENKDDYQVLLIDILRNSSDLNLDFRSYNDTLSYVTLRLNFKKRKKAFISSISRIQKENETKPFNLPK